MPHLTAPSGVELAPRSIHRAMRGWLVDSGWHPSTIARLTDIGVSRRVNAEYPGGLAAFYADYATGVVA